MKGKIMPISFTTLGLSTALAFGPGSFALPAAANDRKAAVAPVQQHVQQPLPMLSMERVIKAVKDHGYIDISKIERERESYEVEARNAAGRSVELDIDAWTGEILKWEYDD